MIQIRLPSEGGIPMSSVFRFAICLPLLVFVGIASGDAYATDSTYFHPAVNAVLSGGATFGQPSGDPEYFSASATTSVLENLGSSAACGNCAGKGGGKGSTCDCAAVAKKAAGA